MFFTESYYEVIMPYETNNYQLVRNLIMLYKMFSKETCVIYSCYYKVASIKIVLLQF